MDGEARRELEAHPDLLTGRYTRLGMTPDEARRAADRQVGNTLLHTVAPDRKPDPLLALRAE
jgi:hypothetical protein